MDITWEHGVATEDELSLARQILDLTGSPSGITRKPLPVDDPQVRQPEIDRARELLGWEPKVSLEEGLQRTINDFRRRLDVGTRPAVPEAPHRIQAAVRGQVAQMGGAAR